MTTFKHEDAEWWLVLRETHLAGEHVGKVFCRAAVQTHVVNGYITLLISSKGKPEDTPCWPGSASLGLLEAHGSDAYFWNHGLAHVFPIPEELKDNKDHINFLMQCYGQSREGNANDE